MYIVVRHIVKDVSHSSVCASLRQLLDNCLLKDKPGLLDISLVP